MHQYKLFNLREIELHWRISKGFGQMALLDIYAGHDRAAKVTATIAAHHWFQVN